MNIRRCRIPHIKGTLTQGFLVLFIFFYIKSLLSARKLTVFKFFFCLVIFIFKYSA
jgi:hypothetical protein